MSKNDNDIGLIASVHGKSSFVKAVDFSFNIHRVCLRFVRYNTNQSQGNKVIGEVPIYIDFADMLKIINLTVHNSFYLKQVQKNLIESKNQRQQYPKPVILHRGGTSAEKLAQQKKSRRDGQCESRIFQISAGMKSTYSLEALLSPGKKINTGIIAPAGKPELTVRVPFSVDLLESFFLSIENAIRSYSAAVYMYRLLYPQNDIPSLLSDYSKKQNTQQTQENYPPMNSMPTYNSQQNPY